MTDRIVSPTGSFSGPDRTGRPVFGLGLLLVSALATLAILIYFGAWAASERVDARGQIDGASGQKAAWEEGLLFVCPFH